MSSKLNLYVKMYKCLKLKGDEKYGYGDINKLFYISDSGAITDVGRRSMIPNRRAY